MRTIDKRRWSCVLLAVAFALAMLIGWSAAATPVYAAKSVDKYKKFYDNFNANTVYNNKTKAFNFEIKSYGEMKLSAIRLYHYNNGKGKTPGTISIYKSGRKIGSWKSKGYYKNQYWDAFPNIYLGKGHYTIQCSSNETWSWNSGAETGFTQLFGKITPCKGIVNSIGNFPGPIALIEVKTFNEIKDYQIRYKIGNAKKWKKSVISDGEYFEIKVKKGKTIKVQARYRSSPGVWGRWGKTKSFRTDRR